MKHYLPVILFVLLAGFQSWYGLIPALTRIDTDFPNYYTSARLILEGRDLSILYDDDLFQAEINRMGIDREGKFAPFPPVTAFVMLPVAWMEPLHAMQAWTLMNLLLLAVCVHFLAKISGQGWIISGLLILGTGLALANNLRFGQTYILLLALMSGSLWLFMNRRDLFSGILGGSGLLLKYFPMALLPLFLMAGRIRPLLWFAVTIALLSISSLAVIGPDVHAQYLTTVLPAHLSGSSLDAYSVTFQSFRTLYNRLLIPDPALNPSAPFDWPAGSPIMLAATQAIVLACLIIGLRRTIRFGRFGEDARLCLQTSLVTLVILMLSPGSATYHFIILTIPAALALRCGFSVRTLGLPLQTALLLTASIGFLPYSAFRTFEHSGILMVLAYPRLITLAVIFSLILCYIMIRTHKKH